MLNLLRPHLERQWRLDAVIMKNSEIASPKLSDDLVNAAREGETELCLSLIAQGADVNRPDRHKIFPLLEATSHRKVETAMALLAHGADILVRSDSGASISNFKSDIGTRAKPDDGASILAFASGWPSANFSKLIDMGADAKALTKNKFSALHFSFNVENSRALLLAGADPNATSNCGETPLSLAVLNYDFISGEELSYLLSNTGKCPTGDSKESNRLAQAKFQNKWKVASLLIAVGADTKNIIGRNAMWRQLFSMPNLHAAAAGGHTEAALALIEKGRNPTDRFLKKTAAQFAIKNGFPETAAMLQAAEARFAVDQILANSRTISARLPRV